MKHVAKDLLESLIYSRNYDNSLLARAEELCNPWSRDKRAASFHELRYNETFFGHKYDPLTIDVLVIDERVEQKIERIKNETLPNEVEVKHEESNINADLLENGAIPKYATEESRTGPSNDENQEEKVELDYCGIKQIDPENLSKELLIDSHEKQWHIFQSTAISIPHNVMKNANLNCWSEESPPTPVETEAHEEEFDDFGIKLIKNNQHTKKVVVTDLLAWNNSPIFIEILKHVFKHRNFEKEISFDISKILAGRRSSFQQEGGHEKAALELLRACSMGLQNTIMRLIASGKVHADCADSRGNTGLLFAVASDKLEAIDTLLNLGANVDALNDECLTPLSLCVLRLLALVHDVSNWSKAFLSNEIIDKSMFDNESSFANCQQWHGRISYESLVRHSDGGESPNIQDNYAAEEIYKNGVREQKYIFDMSPIIIRTSLPQRIIKKVHNNVLKITTKRDMKKKDTSSASEELPNGLKSIQDTNNHAFSEKKARVNATIIKLLRRGADPNFAQVPYPVLIMSIFAKTPWLVSELLERGADPNITLSKQDHYFTPLLILTVLQPCHENSLIAKTLLEAKANPSIRADPDYRSDFRERLSRNRSSNYLDDSQGATALHLLALRPDFDTDANDYLGKLIEVIYRDGCIKSSDLYQGHSPLSLAILEGNLNATKAILKTRCVDVNEELGADLGNAMFMLESRMLQELLPPDALQEFRELLLEYGGCPFTSVKVQAEEYNLIEYGRTELMKVSNLSKSTIAAQGKNRKKLVKETKMAKSSKPPDKTNFSKGMDCITRIAKDKLIRRIKANFIMDLMNSPITLLSLDKRSTILKNPLFKLALSWMTAEDLAVVMKAMNYHRSEVRGLVGLFIMACILIDRKTLSKADTLIQDETERIMKKVMPLVTEKQQTQQLTNFKVNRRANRRETKTFEPIVAHTPESDPDGNKFRVCFDCLSIHGKVLLACPKCHHVYFCSQECNEKNATGNDNQHQCPVFYQEELHRLEQTATTLGIDPTIYMENRFRNPTMYSDMEERMDKLVKSKGKSRSKKRDDILYFDMAKCKTQGFMTIEQLPATIDKNLGDKTIDKDDKTQTMKAIGAESLKNNKKSKRLKNGQNIDGEDKEYGSGDVKSSRGNKYVKADNTEFEAVDNEKLEGSFSKIYKSDDENHDLDSNNKIKLKKRIEVSKYNKDDVSSMKRSSKVRYELGTTNSDIKNKWNDKMESKGKEDNYKHNADQVANSIKVKMGKKKGHEIHKNMPDVDDSNFEGKSKRWWNSRRSRRTNSFNDTNETIKNNSRKQYDSTYEKQTHKIYVNNEYSEGSNTSNKKDVNKKCSESISVKNLGWLLKTGRSAERKIDLDMLLAPYVVFAQVSFNSSHNATSNELLVHLKMA
ncbi:uncharacterized protein LOC125502018 [Athalia rosae]|uniref:uncharacterized protein LOC125502018 n=1 Tax=Athalia rosae TaxID=37344 RepID=UPI002033263E|nr:uncharacterized protein LOC125502018 [Athalia rosae]